MLVIPSLRHCSNKYKLAREGINKEQDKFLFFVFFVFRMKSSSIEQFELLPIRITQP